VSGLTFRQSLECVLIGPGGGIEPQSYLRSRFGPGFRRTDWRESFAFADDDAQLASASDTRIAVLACQTMKVFFMTAGLRLFA
jgi:hypothetical protein